MPWLLPAQGPHEAPRPEHEPGEHDTPERHGRIERATRHVVGSGGGAGGMVPGGSVRSQSVHAVPKGAQRGEKMANDTPEPERLQNTHTGADGLAFTTTKPRNHGGAIACRCAGRLRPFLRAPAPG